ncbi:MAG: hypothetical protein QOF10_6565, partial [Kribbellaceae bacterium]|nr:hypothetical protein [Kribbellaceae bacterium]
GLGAGRARGAGLACAENGYGKAGAPDAEHSCRDGGGSGSTQPAGAGWMRIDCICGDHAESFAAKASGPHQENLKPESSSAETSLRAPLRRASVQGLLSGRSSVAQFSRHSSAGTAWLAQFGRDSSAGTAQWGQLSRSRGPRVGSWSAGVRRRPRARRRPHHPARSSAPCRVRRRRARGPGRRARAHRP